MSVAISWRVAGVDRVGRMWHGDWNPGHPTPGDRVWAAYYRNHNAEVWLELLMREGAEPVREELV